MSADPMLDVLSAAQVFVDKMKSADAALKTEIAVSVDEHTTFHINVKTSKEMFDFADKKTISVPDANGKIRDIRIQAGSDTNWQPEFSSKVRDILTWYWPQSGASTTRKLSLDADELDLLVKVMAELKRQFIASPPTSVGKSKYLKI